MRKRYVLYVNFLLTIILFASNSFAQGSTQWELPQGAKARYGKGWINDVTFSPDGNSTRSGNYHRDLDLRCSHR